MSHSVKRTVTVDLKLTTEEIADLFWEMSSTEQANFFNRLALISSSIALSTQMCMVSERVELSPAGLQVMRLIGQSTNN